MSTVDMVVVDLDPDADYPVELVCVWERTGEVVHRATLHTPEEMCAHTVSLPSGGTVWSILMLADGRTLVSMHAAG